MANVSGRELLAVLSKLNLSLTTTDGSENNLAARPPRLVKQLERNGVQVSHSRPNVGVLQSYGFEPQTVFDVGVDAGTPFLYESFPDAHFVLADPVAESEARVAPWVNKIDFEFHHCAVGAKKGTATVTIPSTETKERIARASLGKFSDSYKKVFATFEEREVNVRTLDTLSKGQTGPFGIKIDTEGFELDVIKGARRALAQAQFVIAEVSLRPRFEGGYRFSQFIAEMGKRGFEPLDLLTGLGPGKTDCDVLFVPYDSAHFKI